LLDLSAFLEIVHDKNKVGKELLT